MKSAGPAGIGNGLQRNWSGETGPVSKSLWKFPCANGANVPCIAAGRRRYSQLRRFSRRGAVNAVPLSCSAYRPCATFCGELRPIGNAPATPSVANSLPNPDWYPVPAIMGSQHAAAHLVALDALEQRLEVAFAEPFVALALDDLEEDRADRILGEDLQQLALPGFRVRSEERR